MREPQPIIAWLEHLFQLIPPAGVVLAGAGPAAGKWLGFLREHQHTPALLIEADPALARMLEKETSSNPMWRIHTEVVAREAGFVQFYQTSVSNENSLVDPKLLRQLWPNLEPVATLNQEAVTFAGLLSHSPTPANWLLIDCLPALDILEGALEQLDLIDLVVARVITSTSEAALHHASLNALSPFMAKRGFRMLAIDNSRHPSLGHALFLRVTCFDQTALIDSLGRSESLVSDQESEIFKLKADLVEAATDALKQKTEIEKITAELGLAEAAARELDDQRKNLEDQHQKLETEIATLKTRFELQSVELSKVETQVSLFQDLILGGEPNDSGKK